jgi:hypothetical protein
MLNSYILFNQTVNSNCRWNTGHGTCWQKGQDSNHFKSTLHEPTVSGIAGPGGGTSAKPVGLTWVGVNSPGSAQTEKFIWHGTRISNKEHSAQAALQFLFDFLRSLPDGAD